MELRLSSHEFRFKRPRACSWCCINERFGEDQRHFRIILIKQGHIIVLDPLITVGGFDVSLRLTVMMEMTGFLSFINHVKFWLSCNGELKVFRRPSLNFDNMVSCLE